MFQPALIVYGALYSARGLFRTNQVYQKPNAPGELRGKSVSFFPVSSSALFGQLQLGIRLKAPQGVSCSERYPRWSANPVPAHSYYPSGHEHITTTRPREHRALGLSEGGLPFHDNKGILKHLFHLGISEQVG